MGLLRLLLAISVVITHTEPVFGIRLLPGQVAVESFFILSGFYMALILSEKYTGRNSSFSMYFSNRLLRLMPLYWFILLLTSAFVYVYHQFTGDWQYLSAFAENYDTLSPLTITVLTLLNFTLVGMGFLFFTGFSPTDGSAHLVTDFRTAPVPGSSFQVVPQAWTLGIEIAFYALAPFLLRCSKSLIYLLISLSLLVRIILHFSGLGHDPWVYRFFPSELAFFLTGILAYKLYSGFRSYFIGFAYGRLVLTGLLVMLFAYPLSAGWEELYRWLLYAAVFVSVPFLFELSRKNRLDCFIGELTYPVYISHMLIVLCTKIFRHYLSIPETYQGELTVLFTLVFSVILYYIILLPVERYRQGRLRK